MRAAAPVLFMPTNLVRRRAAVILTLVLLGVATTGWSSAAPPAAAAKEIEALISHVSALEHVSVRGGPLTVGGPTAARFLRHQLAEKAALIDSAEDFIRLCATRSEQTGRAYLVEYPGGTVLPAATVLAEALKVRRAQAGECRHAVGAGLRTCGAIASAPSASSDHRAPQAKAAVLP